MIVTNRPSEELKAVLWKVYTRELFGVNYTYCDTQRNRELRKASMCEKVLVVGKNSNLWSIINSQVDFDYDEVSSSNIKQFEVNQKYRLGIIFSYGPTEKDNAELLSALSVVVDNVVYVSSQSVLYAEAGYKYSYPRVKLFCEQYLKHKALFEEVTILRLGLVKETYSLSQLEGNYSVTSPEQLIRWLDEFVKIGSSKVEVVSHVNYPFGSEISQIFHRVYKIIQKPNLISFITTRIMDYVLRKYGISWYGYSERFEK